MERFVELVPLEGIALDGLTIRLGSTKAAVEQALGQPESIRQNSWYYFRSELRIDFDGQGRVEFIELLGGPDGALQPRMFGMDVFQAEPDAVYELLKEKNGGEIDDREKGYSYAFLNLSVGLYRESVPENITEMIAEARAGGCPLSADEIEHETRRTHWATAGVGAADYYR